MGFGKFLARVLFQELGVSVPSSVFHVLSVSTCWLLHILSSNVYKRGTGGPPVRWFVTYLRLYSRARVHGFPTHRSLLATFRGAGEAATAEARGRLVGPPDKMCRYACACTCACACACAFGVPSVLVCWLLLCRPHFSIYLSIYLYWNLILSILAGLHPARPPPHALLI
jgi:hypothetical protein